MDLTKTKRNVMNPYLRLCCTKTKAFTLMELVIALVLSFFILGILYLSYNMMVQHFRSEYQKQLSGLVLLKSNLEMDFFTADTIIAEEKQILIFREGEKFNYQFHEDALLRNNNLISDTLFKGDCRTEIVTVENSILIKRLTLKIKVEKDEIKLSFTKCYRPNQILKNKEISFEY